MAQRSISGFISVHIAVLLFGLAGLFGKTLVLSPEAIVCGRAGFAAVALAAFVLVLRRARAGFRWSVLPGFVLLGVLLAAHWVTFFAAIQLSTVAIGLLTFAAFPVFVIVLEPVVLGEALRRRELALAPVALVGVALVVPSFDLGNAMTRGGLVGLLSGALFALLVVFNRRLTRRHDAARIALWENLFAGLVLLPFVADELVAVRGMQLGQLVLLGVVFTALSHALYIRGAHETSASYAGLAGSLEPVYGVLGAALLLGERPGLRTLAGGLLIVAAVALASRRPVQPQKGG